jgi:hypothetical protein
MSKDRQRKEEVRRLRDLVEHPFQAEFNEPLSEAELDALANDIGGPTGLRHKIEILPANKAGLGAACPLLPSAFGEHIGSAPTSA